MGQSRSEILSIERIGRLWAAEARDAAVSAEDIANDLMDAALRGEFEFPVEGDRHIGSKDAPKNIDPETSKFTELFNDEGLPVWSQHLAPYILSKQTQQDGRSRLQAKLEVAREVRLSLQGLERWCDRPDFASWAALRGLSVPTFVPKKASRRPSTIAAEKRCQDWLVDLMRRGSPTKVKAAYLAEAKQEFEISDRGFARAWSEAVKKSSNPDWTKPGPKS
jgi:hypothetical protein